MRRQRSLRLRLLVGAAICIVLALGIAGGVIVQTFLTTLDRERLADLDASLKRLVVQIDPDAEAAVNDALLSDPRFDTPLSGVYWQIEDLDRGTNYRSRSLWDGTLPPAVEGRKPALLQMRGPNAETLIVLSRTLLLESATGARRFRISVAESRDDPEDVGRRFGFDIAWALSAAALCLIVAAWLQVWLGLQPLRTLKSDIEMVRRAGSERLNDNHPEEVQPLVRAVNDLLTAQEDALEFARHRAADLAHGLKTPLAVLAATAERLRGGGDRSNADIIELLAAEMNERIEYQLKLSRLRLRTGTKGVSSSLTTALLRSVSVLRKTAHGEQLNWRVDLSSDIQVDVDEHDLMELVGILLENACKWGTGQVHVECRTEGAAAVAVLNDDGVGLTDNQLKRLGLRGMRMDESIPGEGLGIAIALEIVRLNRGKIEFDRGPLGGLRIKMKLPLAADRPDWKHEMRQGRSIEAQ